MRDTEPDPIASLDEFVASLEARMRFAIRNDDPVLAGAAGVVLGYVMAGETVPGGAWPGGKRRAEEAAMLLGSWLPSGEDDPDNAAPKAMTRLRWTERRDPRPN